MYISLAIAVPLRGTHEVIIILFAAFICRESKSRIEWIGV